MVTSKELTRANELIDTLDTIEKTGSLDQDDFEKPQMSPEYPSRQ